MIPSLAIGNWALDNPLVLAPMAGITDRPFRQLCRRLGAGLAVSEMLTADASLWHSPKSQYRLNHDGETTPRAVQIAGAEAEQLALAAQLNVERGADIIDINMGCPAKKVCSKACGSALLRDEALVEELLTAVVHAVHVPVTLKIRTGWNRDEKNALRIAGIAEDCGIQALSVHGRTREDRFMGEAEFDTVAAVKHHVSIPVIANGDIRTPEQAAWVLQHTHADGLMIGRAAQGDPWVFPRILHHLMQTHYTEPSREEKQHVFAQHVEELHRFYGAARGVRIARKHIGWYISHQTTDSSWKRRIFSAEQPDEQLAEIRRYFTETAAQELAA